MSCGNETKRIALGRQRWRRRLERRRRQTRSSSTRKSLPPSPSTNTAAVGVLPPLRLRKQLIFRAFLPLLPREPRESPPGLTLPPDPCPPPPPDLGPASSSGDPSAKRAHTTEVGVYPAAAARRFLDAPPADAMAAPLGAAEAQSVAATILKNGAFLEGSVHCMAR